MTNPTQCCRHCRTELAAGADCPRIACYMATTGQTLEQAAIHGSYTCALCQGTFIRTRSNEEAIAEALRQAAANAVQPVAMVEVCEDCHTQLTARMAFGRGPRDPKVRRMLS